MDKSHSGSPKMPEFSVTENEVKIGLTEIDRDLLDRNGGVVFPHPVKDENVVIYYRGYEDDFPGHNRGTMGFRVRPKADFPEMQSGKDVGRTWPMKSPHHTLYWTTPRFLGNEPIDDSYIELIKERDEPL